MVKDNDKGMLSFVHQKNALGGLDGQNGQNSQNGQHGQNGQNDSNFDDLKVTAGGQSTSKKRSASAANTQSARSNNRAPDTVRQTRGAAARRESAPQQEGIFGTDASYADKMSTVESSRPAEPPKTQEQLVHPQPQASNGAGYYDHREAGTAVLEGHPSESPPPTGKHTVNAHPGNIGRQEFPSTIANRRISGDSYPETTSGSPSTTGRISVQERDGVAGGQLQTTQYTAAHMPVRGAASHAMPTRARPIQVQPLTQHLSGQGPPALPNLYSQPEHTTMAEVLGAGSQPFPAFAFAPRNTTLPDMARPAQQPSHLRQQPIQQQPQPRQQQPSRPAMQQAKKSAPTHRDQHDSDVMPSQHPRARGEGERQRQHAARQDGGEDRSRNPFAPPKVQKAPRASPTPMPMRQENEMPSELGHQYSDEPDHGFNEIPSGDGQEEQYPLNDAVALDYDPQDLFRMEYSQLKSCPFDSDPNAKRFQLLDPHEADTLQQKIEIVAGMEPHSQADFFSSLDIGEWEEAGDWFLTRFGELATKFKVARKAKREAAREFEDEIEKRHDEITSKHHLTETALAEMKKSGGKVLDGTPKKKKKGSKAN